MKALRIIINSLAIGGTERHLAELLPILARQGWRIKVITTQIVSGENFITTLTNAGITVNTPPKWFRFNAMPKFIGGALRLVLNFFRLWRNFRRDPNTVTHFFLPEAYLLGTLAALAANSPAPKIMSRRSMNDYQKKYPLLRWLEIKWHKHMHIILGNSNRVIEQLQHHEQVPETKLKRIYNGIDVDRYALSNAREKLRLELGIDQQALVFIMVANLIAYKGHEDLLNALALICDQLPKNWWLLCVGRDNGILLHLQKLSVLLQLEDHILWLGVRRDVPQLLASADIGVLCSHEEGFSNAILEGMAAGLPMVVSNVGGNAEAVNHGKTGIVVPSKNPKLLAQGLLQLANQRSYAEALGLAGKKQVIENFSLQTCVDNYQALYQSKEVTNV